MNSIGDGRDVPLEEIRAILSRRKWQILVTFLLIVTSVAAVTFLMPKQYEAHMKILVKNERADMVVSAGSNAQSSFQGEVSETQINTEIELLNSDDLLPGLNAWKRPARRLRATASRSPWKRPYVGSSTT